MLVNEPKKEIGEYLKSEKKRARRQTELRFSPEAPGEQEQTTSFSQSGFFPDLPPSVEENIVKDQKPIGIGLWENDEENVIDEMEIDFLKQESQIGGQSAISCDPCESIPGLYRLLDLCKDEGSNGLVDKIIISQRFVKKLCNEIVPNSFKSISKINFKKLNSKEISLVGVYGRNEMIAKFLLNQNIIDQSIYDSLIGNVDQTINQEPVTLRPGIYLQSLLTPLRSSDFNPNQLQFLVIHWSEEGCYDNLASSHRKKNLTNMHRERDLENIDWQVFRKESQTNKFCRDLTVTKCQEQKEDFELFPGFEVQLPNHMTRENAYYDKQCGNFALDPLIVESVTNQTFVSRDIIPATKVKKEESIELEDFRRKLETQKYALHLTRQLKIQDLEIIVNEGLNLNEIFQPLYDNLRALKEVKNKSKTKQKENLEKGATSLIKAPVQYFKDKYSYIESFLPTIQLSSNLSKVDREFDEREQNLVKTHFERICNEVESKYSIGERLTILNVQVKTSKYPLSRSFTIFREIEVTQPTLVRTTIHTAELSAEDNLQFNKDHSFIPQPYLHSLTTSFEFDPETYELRHISQLENKKLLVFLWNKSTFKLEIYFDTIKRLPKIIRDQAASKKLNIDEQFLLAVNQPKGLIAIYNTEKAVLNTYAFDQEQGTLSLHYANILLLHFYKNLVPKIAHFFFIQNTEDICFVEKNGTAKIYNLTCDRFRPRIAQFPSDSKKVLSTPDGTCIVAFVKEQIKIPPEENEMRDPPQDEIQSENLIDKTINLVDVKKIPNYQKNVSNQLEKSKDPDLNNEQVIDRTENAAKIQVAKKPQVAAEGSGNYITKGYIYFTENFKQDAHKIVEIPLEHSSIENFEFSMLNKKQTHLTTIDREKAIYHSVMVKISHGKTQFRLERQSQSKFLGQVKLEGQRPCTVDGKSTKFMRDIRVGDFLILGENRLQVAEILSDTLLKISPQTPQFVKFEYSIWKDFRIEQRNTVNRLIDVYSMVFTKYATKSPIGRVDQPLTLTIVLDISPENRLNLKEYKRKFQEYVQKMFSMFKKDTKKSMGHLKQFNTKLMTFQEFDDFEVHANKYKLGEWMVDFFCLIPLQIAVARDNVFVPFQDGLSTIDIDEPLLDDGYGFISSVSKTISFGWYEAIFKHYANLEVKVVSSMGEQSCVKTDDILYVALDFEGWFASIERTPQEETFLQLLNAAVSNLVLFKSRFTISRDISTMFQGFQDGMNYFGDDLDIFQARFCIIITDVAEPDQEDVTSEFESKLSRIVDKDEENNFITKLYANNLSVIPWPVFKEASFYENFVDLKDKFDPDSKYENTRIFVEKLKILMTKLKVCDWGSVQATLITIRTLELKKYLKNAISYGFEQKEDFELDISIENTLSNTNSFENELKLNIKHLMSRDDGQLIPDPEVLLVEIFHDTRIRDGSIKLMPDSGLVLLKDGMTLTNLSSDILGFFEEKIQARSIIPDSQWLEQLETFVKFIIQRRVKRVQQWFARNTNRFEKEQNEIIITNYVFEQEISRLSLFWNFCRLRCNSCGLLCMKASRHSDNEQDMTHDCLTDHKCHSECQFSEAHLNQTIPKCNQFAGHEGGHACEKSHACGASCIYDGKRNCQLKCAKDIGHGSTSGNKDHLCGATRHYCGSPCSLKTKTQKGEYECHNTCIIPCEEIHSVHKCENEVCPLECPISNCHRRCESKDHFHDLEGGIDHFCGEEHQCAEDCEENGICKIITEPTAIKDEYVNKFGSFMYTKYLQKDEKLPCCIKIPPYKFKHDGKHVHEEKKEHKFSRDCPSDMGLHIKEEEKKQYNFHYCDVKCPNCSYYTPYMEICIRQLLRAKKKILSLKLKRPYSLTKNLFFTILGHRLTLGDRGDFVLCHKLCENIGRHRHIEYCKNPNVCEADGELKKEGILEHINAAISPNPDRKKDYVSHKVYWDRTNFQDPYSKDNRENFKKCDHECPDEKHKIDKATRKDYVRSFCTQNIFHAKLDHKKALPENNGYISIDGHHFDCENPVKTIGDFHIIFVVDSSSSMIYDDCKPRCDSTETLRLLDSHKNRLGAVYEACYTFIEARKSSRKNTTAGQSAIDRDTTSLVLFSDTAKVAFENRSLSNSDELLEKMMQYRPLGDTSYKAGILKVADIINQHYDSKKTNVIVFLSDGEDHAPESELRNLCQREANRGSPLLLYTIKFTGVSDSLGKKIKRWGDYVTGKGDSRDQSLLKMADIATEYLPKGDSKDALKSQYVLAVNEIELIEHFTEVASSLRNHQPMLISENIKISR
ncbi:hypothetical protein G9A89_023435 [Geosiphon pyriformis]|nr:hypothetical protein G9A89_023435 [Geosiphon pyriformis]